jgi:hypothetical protein
MSVRSTVVLATCTILATAVLATAQQTQTVRGTVTAVSDASFTVDVQGKPMTFAVDKTTKVTAHGAGTAERQARQAGQPGIPFSSAIKTGDRVQVDYREMDGKMVAASVLSGLAESALTTEAPESMVVNGMVTAVEVSKFTIKAPSGDMTFAVTKDTDVIGIGIGTKTREMKQAGKAPLLMDLLSSGDQVEVRYTGSGMDMTASSIRVTHKNPK